MKFLKIGVLSILGIIATLSITFSFAESNGLISNIDLPDPIAEVTTYGGSFRNAIRTIVNFFLYFLGIIATIMIIYGGFIYVTGGATGNQEKAKKIIIFAAIGIIVILISYALVNTLLGAGQNTGVGAQ